MALSVNGVLITEAHGRVLLQMLATPEIALDALDPRLPPAMEKVGIATVEATYLRVSPRGRAIAKALKDKGWEPEPLQRVSKRVAKKDTNPLNGTVTRPASDGPTRTATQRPSPEGDATPTPLHRPPAHAARQLLDLDKLRADLKQRYERDLAALDRFAEIAAELGG